jgi:hypothetical protein
MLAVNLLLHAETESWGDLIWSPRLIHATEWILNFSLTPSRDTVMMVVSTQNFTIRRNLKQQLVNINAKFDVLQQELLPYVRGHAAA